MLDLATLLRYSDPMKRSQWKRLSARGDSYYRRLLPRIRRHRGKIVAIELESGQFLLGRDELTVALHAMKKYPGKRFGVYRIGHPAVHKFRSRRKC